VTEQALTKQLDVMELGNLLAKSGYFKDATDAAQAVVKVLAGQELGFGPVASMTGIYIVKGRVTLSANLLGAAIKRSGRYDYHVGHLDDTECAIGFFAGSGDERRQIGISTFTIDDAKRAGLINGDNWKKYPRNMLFARALSNGAKWYCPDVFGGPIYTPDELGIPVDPVDGETFEVIDVTPGWQPATKGETDDPNQDPEPKPSNGNGLTAEQIIAKNKALLIRKINELNDQLKEPNEIDLTWLAELTENELISYGQVVRRAVEAEQVPDDMQGVE